jgi:hypothetical protein
MALSKRTRLEALSVREDGTLIAYEVVEYWEGGFVSGTLEHTTRRTGRMIDVGDDVTAEEPLIKDTVSGDLHTTERIAGRDAVKALR